MCSASLTVRGERESVQHAAVEVQLLGNAAFAFLACGIDRADRAVSTLQFFTGHSLPGGAAAHGR
jgi:hypothetical protein